MHASLRSRILLACALWAAAPSFAAASAAATASPPARARDDRTFRSEVAAYLANYGATYQRLYTEWIDACLDAGTHPDPAETRARRVATQLALFAFTGSIENIELSRAYVKREKELPAVSRRELKRIAHLAADAPRIVPDLVEERVAGDVEARDTWTDFAYERDGGRTNPTELARVLRTSRDLLERRSAWECAVSVGVALRPVAERQRWLRNECVRAMGRRDWFDHRATESGLSAGEIQRKAGEILHDLRPLQTALHTWLRYELARRYGQPVPDLVPAHWLPEVFGQAEARLIEPFPAGDADAGATLDPRAIAGEADAFFTSLGFRPMAATSWNLSTWTAVAPGAGLLETFEPDAWHVDLDREVRWRASVEPGIAGFAATLRTLGRSHADLATASSDVPVVLRHGGVILREAVGDFAARVGTRPRTLFLLGLAGDPDGITPDERTDRLLSEALDTFAFVSFGAGTVLTFEREIYGDDLPTDRWNARWWQLVARYQGIAPPSARDERWCDALALPALSAEPATYFQRAFGRVLSYQLGDHVARKLLDADPRTVEVHGRREVGDFLRSLLRLGGSVDWRAKLRERVGSDLSARALLDYFEPLRAWLDEQNRGRRDTLPPL